MQNSTSSLYLDNFSAIHTHYCPKKILLVTGQQSYVRCGAKEDIEQAFPEKNYVQFNKFSTNPKLEDAISGAKLALKHNIDLILAIGGGSVIDMAKLIKALMPDPTSAKDIVTEKSPIKELKTPLVAIPTTAGSGSEATHFAVAYIAKEKFSLASPHLLPNAIVLKETFLHSSSPYQRAVNVLDALAQAIEGYWAVNSTPRSRQLSLSAITLLVKHLPRVVYENDSNALKDILWAAHLAGQVINITKTTAPHAFSYAFTSYHDIPHGHAVWLTLPTIFEIHLRATVSDVIDPRGKEHLMIIMHSLVNALNINPQHPKSALQEMMKAIGIEPNMHLIGLNNKDERAFAAQQVNIERLNNNPVTMNQSQVGLIFNL